MKKTVWCSLLTLTVALPLTACSGSDEEASPTPSASPTPAPGDVAVAVRFEAVVADDPFTCGEVYPNLGTTASTFEPADLRLYVYDVQLIRSTGEKQPLLLEQDGKWQLEQLALLDFEDASGRCESGTAELNTTLRGTILDASYEGISFVVGVPFELNHADASTAASPLNITSMFWSWNSGYKFLQLDGFSTGQSNGLSVHLGSTECQKDAAGTVTGCNNPNRVEVTLTGFDPLSTPILVDLAALFSNVDLDVNTSGTAPLCMSAPNDPECAALFANLGLPFDGSSASFDQQKLFRVE